jgi:UDP-glucose 4-epimerase
MKIIVTGGCGFIGSHIVDKLCDLNYQVIVIDDLSASENDKFYFNEKSTYHKIDICDKDKMDHLFEGVDYIFHLAAESRIQPAIQNPNRAYNVNVIGTLNILELSKKYNVKRIMYSSTSSVYGLTNTLPTPEESDVDCLNPYSQSKLMGEELFRYYYKNHKIDSVIFRYFNVFGERSPIKGQYAPVVGIFLNQLKDCKSLTVVGDGEKKRDFIHVSDIADVNISAMLYTNPLESTTINVGSGKNISIKNIAKQISNNYINLPPREGEAENTLASTDKMKGILNFTPKIDVIDWINETLKKL